MEAVALRLAPAGGTASHPLREQFGSGLGVRRRAAAGVDVAGAALRGEEFPLAVLQDGARPGGSPRSTGWSAVVSLPVDDDPYWFAAGAGLLSGAQADALLEWLEAIDSWRAVDGGFYLAKERALSAAAPSSLTSLLSAQGLHGLEAAASELFSCGVRLHGPLVAHKMSAGDGVGVHSDRPSSGEETHRLLMFLTRPADLRDGGHFLLLGGPDPSTARLVLPRRHNTALAFRLTGESYHAVSTVVAGVRYALVISFSPAH